MEPAALHTADSDLVDEAAEFASVLKAYGLQMASADPTEFVDRVEEVITRMPLAPKARLEHIFTPGLYTRVLCMPAGMILTSKIHKTKHPFAILNGVISVWTKETDTITYVAPFLGVTEPDTRRILYVHEDTRWATFHPTDKTDLAEIEEELIMKHENTLLEGRVVCPP